METLPVAKTNGESSVGESLLCHQGTTDPVVYKLVRVEGDGRLVPATDDEVMEVEDLLDDGKNEPSLVEDSNLSNNGISAEKHPVHGPKGFENAEVDAEKLNARLEYIEEMLQKVKQEERLRLLCEYPDHSSKCTFARGEASDHHHETSCGEEHLEAANALHEAIPQSRLGDRNTVQLMVSEALPMHAADETVLCGSTAVDNRTKDNPGSSTMEGERCLDSLSIRELQETFRATFGRTTSVKDKLWLKRRIAMGLTNTYDVPMSNFVIRGKTLVSKNPTGEQDGSLIGPGEVTSGCTDVSVKPSSQMKILEEDSAARSDTAGDAELKHDDFHVGATISKRIRKPTKRYIEELSEVETRECSGRASSFKSYGVCRSLSVRPFQSAGPTRTSFITRQDSFGGSGVQVPCVSRVRRGRPRQNFLALMKYQSTGMSAKLVQKALGVQISRQDGESETFQNIELPKQMQHLSDDEKEKQMIISSGGLQQTADMDSSGDDRSDLNVATVPTANGGTRRKHHRAWTLTEVIKLVEGVSRYGAGRWSEIKRLAFASSSYRTSVDLKDKWRNLLRASFSQGHPTKGVKPSRKHGSVPLPAPILSRVRELAEMHGQCSYYPPSNRLVECQTGGENVNETKSGFL